jgi:4-hydroxy-3-methylbut-2-enyl diphosphate reductase
MPQVLLAKTAGFCFGVNRAVRMAYALAGCGKRVCTLGPLIHNPRVVGELAQLGVTGIARPEDAPPGCIVVVRTHGVPRATLAALRAGGRRVVDATCPFVSRIHEIAAEAGRVGAVLLIAGDDQHPETLGICGACGGVSWVFDGPETLDALLRSHPEYSDANIIVVAQTTFGLKDWETCVKKIKNHCTNANIFDTICNATQERQREALALALACDAMVIIGGRHSSNTQKLARVCEPFCPTFLIEGADELPKTLGAFGRVGVTAGASTPAAIIKEVLETMSELENQNALERQTPIAEETAAPAAPEEVSANAPAPEDDFSAALEESLKKMNSDQKVRGVVTGIYPSEIQVDIGRKQTGYVPIDEYSGDLAADPAKELKLGDVLDLIIMKTNDAEGTVALSKKKFDAIQAWDGVVAAEGQDTILEGMVTEVIRGGVLVNSGGVRVFIPASQATAVRGEPLEGLLKTHVRFRVIEVNRQRRRAVGSIRAVLKDLRNETENAFWNQAAVGQVYHGTVKSLTSYGAFVDIGGVDGMVHISELSWQRVKTPAEVVAVGDRLEVYIKALDEEKRKISLGYKKAEDNPWERLRQSYAVGSVTEAEVVGMTPFGAFARVLPGVDGLIHVSQIAGHHVAKPQDELKIGQVVAVKIVGIDFDKKRVSLSIRALEEDAGEAEAEEPAGAEPAPEEIAD